MACAMKVMNGRLYCPCCGAFRMSDSLASLAKSGPFCLWCSRFTCLKRGRP